jgi:hypothetical protein
VKRPATSDGRARACARGRFVYPKSGAKVPVNGPTPGALQGDDYPLEYYEDGYPKLPACLDRRPKASVAEAA